MPVSIKDLTDSIFGLNSHDEVLVGKKIINGQKLKELFITTIFLRFLEGKNIKPNSHVFIVLPQGTDTPCDTAVIVAEPDQKPIPNGSQLKLAKSDAQYIFQVKEYFDFDRAKDGDAQVPKLVEVAKLEKVTDGNYTEQVLIFMRDLSHFRSEDIKEFLDKHPSTYLISVPTDITFTPKDSSDGKPIPLKLDPLKHNYLITFPGETFATLSFDRPQSLLSEEQINHLLKP